MGKRAGRRVAHGWHGGRYGEWGYHHMLLGLYDTKDALRHSVGQPLHYQETQILVCEYRPTGVVAVRGVVAGGGGRSWTAEVTLRDGHIVFVE